MHICVTMIPIDFTIVFYPRYFSKTAKNVQRDAVSLVRMAVAERDSPPPRSLRIGELTVIIEMQDLFTSLSELFLSHIAT
jgi:hypothetical protein